MLSILIPAIVLSIVGYVLITSQKKGGAEAEVTEPATKKSGIAGWVKDTWNTHWPRHGKYALGVVVGLTLLNYLLYITPPFHNWYVVFRHSDSYWPINILLLAILLARNFGKSGIFFSKVLTAVACIAIISFIWSGFISSKLHGDDATQLARNTTSNREIANPTAKKFVGNARDHFNGPDKAYVLAYWKDDSLMADIAGAESQFNQFSDSTKRTCEGTLKHVNDNGTTDWGVMQINEVHLKEANRLGHDVCTLKGNLDFARVLYEREGTNPWSGSRYMWKYHCFKKTDCVFDNSSANNQAIASSGNSSNAPSGTRVLQVAESNEEAVELDNVPIFVPATGKTRDIPVGNYYISFASHPDVDVNVIRNKVDKKKFPGGVLTDPNTGLGGRLTHIAFESATGDTLTIYICVSRSQPRQGKCVL